MRKLSMQKEEEEEEEKEEEGGEKVYKKEEEQKEKDCLKMCNSDIDMDAMLMLFSPLLLTLLFLKS